MNDKVRGFCAGAIVASITTYVLFKLFEGKKTHHSVCDVVAEDNCLSLFYDKDVAKDGRGFPELNTARAETITQMRTTHPEYTKVPVEIYKSVVENMVIACVDVIGRRQDGKILLFYRRDAPAANIWWWPGGRIFRGETFFDSAVRKLKDETNNKDAEVTPVGVLTVWNTFFPDSHWDKERKKGREGTQTVNVIVVCDVRWLAEYDLNTNVATEDWAVASHRWITPQEAIVPGAYDKYISENVKLALDRGLLH